MTTKTPSRLGPLARRTADDDDFKAAVRRAALAGRTAIFKPAPPPARLERIGTAVREAGTAISVVGRNAEKERRAEQRTTQLRVTLIGGTAAAAGAALYRRSAATKTREAEPVEVAAEPVVVAGPGSAPTA